MRSSRTGNVRGFTLLEILVVLVIVGIVVTFAVLSISGKSQEARMASAADRLQAVFKLASDEAIVRNLQLGLRVQDHSYRFLRLNDQNHWVTYTNDQPLRPHRVAQDIDLHVFVQGLKADIPGQGSGGAKASDNAPQAVFLSSGEATPFTLEVHASGVSSFYQVNVDMNGKITSKHEGTSS